MLLDAESLARVAAPEALLQNARTSSSGMMRNAPGSAELGQRRPEGQEPISGQFAAPLKSAETGREETQTTFDAVDGSRHRHRGAKLGLLLRNHQRGSRAMNEVTTIGLDLAKNIFRYMALMRRVERLFAGS
jgi:hypothetical protein